MKQNITNFLTSDKGIFADAAMLVIMPTIILTGPFVQLNLAICVVLALLYAWLQGGIGKNLGFRKPASFGRLLLYSFGLAIAFIIALYPVAPLVEYLTGVPHDASAFDVLRGNLPNYLIMLAMGWIIGGFFEEILFRAFMMKTIMRLLGNGLPGTIIATVIPAAFFGYLHGYQGLTGQILTGTIGFGLALLYLRNGHNTWQNILIHGIIDTILFTLIFLNLDKVLGLI